MVPPYSSNATRTVKFEVVNCDSYSQKLSHLGILLKILLNRFKMQIKLKKIDLLWMKHKAKDMSKEIELTGKSICLLLVAIMIQGCSTHAYIKSNTVLSKLELEDKVLIVRKLLVGDNCIPDSVVANLRIKEILSSRYGGINDSKPNWNGSSMADAYGLEHDGGKDSFTMTLVQTQKINFPTSNCGNYDPVCFTYSNYRKVDVSNSDLVYKFHDVNTLQKGNIYAFCLTSNSKGSFDAEIKQWGSYDNYFIQKNNLKIFEAK